jgi:hypothetical protein
LLAQAGAEDEHRVVAAHGTLSKRYLRQQRRARLAGGRSRDMRFRQRCLMSEFLSSAILTACDKLNGVCAAATKDDKSMISTSSIEGTSVGLIRAEPLATSDSR